MFKKLVPVIITLAVSSCTSLSNEGANYVVVTKKSEGIFPGSGVIGGKAYRCII
jgi:hypothetical protein